ncbi:hypothetical protein L6452_37291 [Arctium lappa]|uniref:Uncharacterized protein n=1 Tax=Arctium lappa TaxID=4217 RepID=A0ACB8Y3A4_ARCLA|nr:hypothetical protein L6452_37291 [Arctium lappa]
MAKEMDDGKFWLPAEFLNDEDVLMDFKPNFGITTSSGLSTLNSDLSSPVESVMGSTETESDEEDYLNELSRKLAQSTLDDNFEANFSRYSKSTRVMAGSPQSTLCGCKQMNSNESAWDLLYAAAGEVARLRMAEETGSKYYNPNRNHVAPQPPPRIPSPNLHFHHLQAAKFQQQQQYQQFLQQTRVGGGNMKPVALPSSTWPTLQQSQPQVGSGMRAVFLGNPNTKRECSGTGVFLPRQIGAPTETRKKRGCSTVLLPDRVIQALNLNLETQTQTQTTGGRPRDYDAEMSYRKSVLMAEQRRQQVEKDLRLPQEWTY